MSDILPHHLACALLIRTLFEKDESDLGMAHGVSSSVRRKFLLVVLNFLKHGELSWQSFFDKVNSVDAKVASAVSKELQSIENVDHYMNFFKALEDLLDGRTIQKSSILGLFLRKLILKFKKMDFFAAVQGCESLKTYLNTLGVSLSCNESPGSSTEEATPVKDIYHDTPSKATVDVDASITSDVMDLSMDMSMEGKSMNMSMDAKSLDMSVECKSHDLSLASLPEDNDNKEKSTVTRTPAKLEVFPQEPLSDNLMMSQNHVERFIAQQAKLVEVNEAAALPPNILEEKIRLIQQHFPKVIDVHYLSFLNYIRISDLNKAAVELQLYFDYKSFQEESTDPDSSEIDRHQLKFKRYRYCALNMGILHCCHGNYGESLTSLQEAIRISQETNDQRCLDHAMFWLCLVQHETGDVKSDVILKQLTEKSMTEEVSDTVKSAVEDQQSLETLGMLRLILYDAYSGRAAPESAFKKLFPMLVERISNLSGPAQLLRSGLWDFYGYRQISSICCQIPLQSALTHTLTHNDNLKLHKDISSEETTSLAYCQLARQHQDQGLYQEAKSILEFSKKQVTIYSRHKKLILLCQSQIEFDRCVFRRDVQGASKVVNTIGMIDPLDAKYRSSIIDVLRGNYTKAEKNASSMLLQLKSNSRVESSKIPVAVLKACLLILIIELQLMSANPMVALDKILELIAHAREFHLKGYEIDANILLARCQLIMCLFSKAEQVLKKIFVFTLAQGSCYQQGLLYYFSSLCLLEKHKAGQEIVKTDDDLSEALKLLDKSFEHAERCNAVSLLQEIHAQEALVYHLLGNIQDRNRSSTKFRRLHEQTSGIPSILSF